ncbi:autotransporter family protein [Fusobacterium ulcerans]|uniref:autotransporter family protein n=1 Tax=Fusobacterium ulcerans TaxID=861 RepID=UPI001D0A0C98|nr:autotransporter outer membrane beta-barrel domain-containing protein [Fusobacterium ulcerans]MCB8563979.1 autotransporter outer membrane beta-barrel domain-containing protein [Fusobacterium ulcerans]MCB8648180.1 autotransporter outer membrane beta-barrel domain-containing protein [Fusobacterium ulcerans]
MIEKIMRAVKSNNKKRGRNVTIGAVVGILLSCSAVIKADDYLWIKGDSGTIEFSTDGNSTGTGETWEKENPYNSENSWNGKIYINNMALFGNDNGKVLINSYEKTIGYGLRLSGDLGEIEFINNGLIFGAGSVGSFGIYNDGGNIGSIKNNGTISGNYGDGIYNYSTGLGSKSIIGSLVNGGSVLGDDSGIFNKSENSGSSIIGSLQNIGMISGDYGIYNSRAISGSSNIESLVNSGTIYGGYSGISNGSYGSSSTSTIGILINTGAIYGSSSAILNGGGTINNAVNYGLLVSKDGSVVQNKNDGTANFIKSYGLAFKVENDGSYILDEKYSGKFGEIYGNTDVVIGYGKKGDEELDFDNPITEKYTIINAKEDKTNSNVTGTESLTLENGKLTYYDSDETSEGKYKEEIINSTKKYILNGITDTLLVSTGDNKLNNIIINAYGTAVKFDNNGGNLSLLGTIINGGIKDGTVAIKGYSDDSNTLILEGAEVSYAGGKNRFQQTIINGDIDMQNGDNTVTLKNGSVVNGSITTGTGTDTLNIENGSQINGTLNGGIGATKDILNFGENIITKAKIASNNDEIRIQHNISNFEKINVNTNVTFYESTISNDIKKMESLKVTGVNNLTIGENGILTLRIDGANGNSHALSSNTETGTIKSEEGGKFLLALNGAGLNTKISFGNLELDKSLVTGYEGKYQEDVTFETTSVLHSVKRTLEINEVEVEAKKNLPSIPSGFDDLSYEKLNKIYHSILSVEDLLGNFNVDDDEKLSTFLGYLNDIYAGNPYSYSNELSRKSAGMFRDIVTDNIFKADAGKWMIYGGLTHVDGGTKDTYYGKGYYTYDIGSSDMDADTKITGAYMLGEYGVSDTLTSGIVIGGNKLKSDLSNGSKVDGSALYLGAYAKKYIGNLKLTAGLGFQYGDYDADRLAINRVASDSAESVMKYSDNYNDMTYDIYLNGRYSHQVGENLYLEPYATLSYTYIDQDGANEGNKILAIETDSKSFDYTVGKMGVDLKKVIPHEKGKSTLSAGVSYTRIFDGAEEEYITGRFKGGRDFDILVAHKNEHSIGLNAKYALELENGVLFDVKGTYSVERDSHNGSGKNRTKGEWIAGAGMGYKF